MDEVRAIRLGAEVGTGFQGSAENRQTLVQGQQPNRRRIFMPVPAPGNCPGRSGWVVALPNVSLC
jgi:hypothetical protein